MAACSHEEDSSLETTKAPDDPMAFYKQTHKFQRKFQSLRSHQYDLTKKLKTLVNQIDLIRLVYEALFCCFHFNDE